jgi:hypothetical protein
VESKETALEGLVWQSLVYNPHDTVGDLAGPDLHNRCETPRHRFGDSKPLAGWLEMLWYPHGDKTVARAWKTCEECHVLMSATAEKENT